MILKISKISKFHSCQRIRALEYSKLFAIEMNPHIVVPMSDGNWIFMIHYSTTTSQNFWSFLYLLKVYLNWQNNYKDKQVIVTLDNASIHSTADVKVAASKLRMKIIALPSYWPHLVPVEYVFGAIFGHIRNTSIYGIIDNFKNW